MLAMFNLFFRVIGWLNLIVSNFQCHFHPNHVSLGEFPKERRSSKQCCGRPAFVVVAPSPWNHGEEEESSQNGLNLD